MRSITSLRFFKPDIELDEIKPKPLPARYAAYKGEVARIVLGTLRDATRACTTQELTMHVMAERGMNTADKRLTQVVGKRVDACLRLHRAKGLTSISNRPWRSPHLDCRDRNLGSSRHHPIVARIGTINFDSF